MPSNVTKHMLTKRKQLRLKLKDTGIGSFKSKFPVDNKLFLNNAILNPIWTCEIQLWSTAVPN